MASAQIWNELSPPVERPEQGNTILSLRDTVDDPALDRVSRLASRLFNVPYAFVSLVDRGRLWCRARHGHISQYLDPAEDLARIALKADGILQIPDTRNDPLTGDHVMVRGAFGLRFYAAVPLRTPERQAIGVLALLDTRPRSLKGDELILLDDLAAILVEQMSLRLTSRQLQQTHAVLGAITSRIDTATGDAFFRSLVEQLASAMGVAFAVVAEATDETLTRARTIAVWAHGAIADNFEYDIQNTPCQTVLTEGVQCYPDQTRERFPLDDLLVELKVESYAGIQLPREPGRGSGWLCLMSTEPLINRNLVVSVLRAFANRASVELERMRAEEALRLANETLEQRVAERTAELKESEERFALAAKGANDGLWDWDLRTNCIHYSGRWKSMLGLGETDIEGSPREWFRRVHRDDLGRLLAEIAAHLEAVESHLENEHRIQHSDGSYRWVLTRGLAVRDAGGAATRFAGSLTDITSRKEAEAQLVRDALRDPLTGLPNRALFMDRLGHAVERAKRHPENSFAMLFVDLDRFKVINDSLGHLAGDRLLQEIALRLETCIRPEDTVARMGGDEFTILIEGFEEVDDATRLADRIRHDLLRPFSIDGQKIFTAASIGIALSKTGYQRAEDVVRDADIAMYRAKALGRARYAVYDTGMHAHAVALLQLETDLREGLQRREFRLFYQPIVSMRTGEIMAFEALLRWQHPTRGVLLPGEFLQVAEETGLLESLGNWVLAEACHQARLWKDHYPNATLPAVSVNLCAGQFRRNGLVEYLERLLAENDVSGEVLRLEITEGAIMENAAEATELFNRLKSLSIKLFIDDFGTGYSSLSYLHRFPIDTLKIDQSFIQTMIHERNNLEIVRTIITLARNLDMDVIAEGVENEEQLMQLVALGCDMVQGFLICRPQSSEIADAMIADAVAGKRIMRLGAGQ